MKTLQIKSTIDLHGKKSSSFFLGIAICLMIFSVFAFIPSQMNVQIFQAIGTPLPGVVSGDAAWGDYDNDGDLDFIISGEHEPWVCITSLFKNEGDDSFVEINAGFIGLTLSSIEWGDFDNDNDLDVLLTGSTEGFEDITKIYRNDGNDQFVDINADIVPLSTGRASWGDYDNDGDQDVIVTGNGNSQDITKIYRNDNGLFTETDIQLPGYWFSTVSWIDYDNDCDQDFILCGRTFSGHASHLFRNDQNDVFTEIETSFFDLSSGSISCADYNSDGKTDVLLSGFFGEYNGEADARIYKDEGDGSFTDINAGILSLGSQSANWGDYDGDGDMDFVLPGTANMMGFRFELYRNDGGNNFVLAEDSLSSFGDAVVWGDYDNDGDLDLLCAGMDFWEGPQCTILRNEGGFSANTKPSPPTGLSAIVTGNTVALSWHSAEDAETPATGLTYNLYLGTETETTDIMSPMANVKTGKRLVPHSGNVCQDTSWILKYLAPGAYYWSVQAIDNNFEGSEFAGEASFTITSQLVSEINTPEIKLFPNPTMDELYITCADGSGIYHIQILNSKGLLEFEDFHFDCSLPLNLKEFSKGVYFIRIFDSSRIFTQKVILK